MGCDALVGVPILSRVGLGWFAPLCVMSEQLRLWDDGSNRPDDGVGRQSLRASLYREMHYLLTLSTGSSRVGRLSPAGIAHSLGVCLIEDWAMSRGKAKAGKGAASGTMPRFVDVKLTQEQREEFASYRLYKDDSVSALQSLSDDGYRVGVSWSGEQSAYTVSLTCRDADSPNNGLCMTSFAKTLETAIRLAVFKHVVVTEGRWVEGAFGSDEEFG